MKALNRIAIGFATLLVLPFLFMKGMFMDGAMYAAVSLNMAEGIGSFWQPYYGQDFFGLDGFYENPPLGLFNLSVFFRIFGDGFWVERLFIALLFFLSIWGLRLNLEVLKPGAEKGFWFSLIIWVLMPTMFWTFRYNMMEVQLIPVLLFSHWWFLWSKDKNTFWVFGPFIFAVFNLIAFLIKGPVGVFLLAAPFIYTIFIDRKKTHLIYGLITVVFSLCLGFGLLLFDGAEHFFDQYLFVRTAERLANNPTVSSHFWILGELFQQLVLPILISALLVIGVKKKFSPKVSILDLRYFWYLIGIAFSGSLPLMVSLVQRPFYLSTSFPFYAMAIAVLLLPALNILHAALKTRGTRYLNLFSYVLLSIAIGLFLLNWGKFKRDEVLITDMHSCVEELPKDLNRIYVTDQVIFNWSLKAYMMRYERIDLLSFHGFDPDKSIYLLSQEYIPHTEHGKFKEVSSFQYFKLYKLEETKL